MSTALAVRDLIDRSPMRRVQTIAIGLTFLLSALDGYDVLAVTFAAPAIGVTWGLGKGALGIVLSAGLGGMALGAFLLAPLADVLGRKTLLLVSLLLMAVGMALCAVATSPMTLALFRVVAGLGIGACVAVINPVAAEFANARRRPLTVSIMAIGYPVGGVVGGLAAAALLHAFDWRAIFVAGTVAALVLLPAVALLLPESLAFLLARPRADGLAKVNAALGRLGHAPVDALVPATVPPRSGYSALFAPSQLRTTAWIAAVNGIYVLAVYYVLSWLPQMVADAGFPPATASLASASASLAGVVGGLTLGWLAQRGNLRWLCGGAMLAFGLTTMLFGLAPASLPLLLGAAAICGFFLFGSACGVYATIATMFDDAARASGTGFVSGVGRVSSAIAPLVAGWLFATGLSRAEVSGAFGTCAILAAVLLVTGWRKQPS